MQALEIAEPVRTKKRCRKRGRPTAFSSFTQLCLADRQARDAAVTGLCRNCGINCYGANAKPPKDSMPCNVAGCPYEGADRQVRLSDADVARVLELTGERGV